MVAASSTHSRQRDAELAERHKAKEDERRRKDLREERLAMERAREFASLLASGPPLALAAVKAVVR